MTVHINEEYIKAWAESPEEVELQGLYGTKWLTADITTLIEESKATTYRFDPHCKYVKGLIAGNYGEDGLNLYDHWLEGGELEYYNGEDWVDAVHKAEDVDYPYKAMIKFLTCGLTYRKKKNRNVLWVGTSKTLDEINYLWCEEGKKPHKSNLFTYKKYAPVED